MTEINFIPEQYQRRQRRRKNLARQLVLIGFAVLCLAGWAMFQSHSTQQLRSYANTLEQQVHVQRDRLKALKNLQQQHERLTRKARVQRRLAQTLSHTRILNSLTSVLPDDVALTDLRMITHRPNPVQSEADPESTLALAKRAAPQAIRVDFQAVASAKVTVANVVATLGEHPVFSDVTMRHSQTRQTKGRRLRHFELTMKVDLQRRFELVDSREEVAHVR
jgi:Tfp pilus assembly protein PilN